MRAGTTADDWQAELDGWNRLGATHVTLNGPVEGGWSVAAHLEALGRVREALE